MHFAKTFKNELNKLLIINTIKNARNCKNSTGFIFLYVSYIIFYLC